MVYNSSFTNKVIIVFIRYISLMYLPCPSHDVVEHSFFHATLFFQYCVFVLHSLKQYLSHFLLCSTMTTDVEGGGLLPDKKPVEEVAFLNAKNDEVSMRWISILIKLL